MKTLRETNKNQRFPKKNQRILKENDDFPTKTKEILRKKQWESVKYKKNLTKNTIVVMNMCGRGDKDIFAISKNLGFDF